MDAFNRDAYTYIVVLDFFQVHKQYNILWVVQLCQAREVIFVHTPYIWRAPELARRLVVRAFS